MHGHPCAPSLQPSMTWHGSYCGFLLCRSLLKGTGALVLAVHLSLGVGGCAPSTLGGYKNGSLAGRSAGGGSNAERTLPHQTDMALAPRGAKWAGAYRQDGPWASRGAPRSPLSTQFDAIAELRAPVT